MSRFISLWRLCNHSLYPRVKWLILWNSETREGWSSKCHVTPDIVTSIFFKTFARLFLGNFWIWAHVFLLQKCYWYAIAISSSHNGSCKLFHPFLEFRNHAKAIKLLRDCLAWRKSWIIFNIQSLIKSADVNDNVIYTSSKFAQRQLVMKN